MAENKGWNFNVLVMSLEWSGRKEDEGEKDVGALETNVIFNGF
jgi:hypothetical protein